MKREIELTLTELELQHILRALSDVANTLAHSEPTRTELMDRIRRKLIDQWRAAGT